MSWSVSCTCSDSSRPVLVGVPCMLFRLKQHPHTSGVIPLMRYRSPLYALSNGIHCDAQHLSGLGHRSPVGSRLSGTVLVGISRLSSTILAVTSRLSSTVLYGVLFLHNL